MSFDAIVNAVTSGFAQFSFGDAIDILIIAMLIYAVILWSKRTRAFQVLKGMAVLLLCAAVSQLFSLYTVSWLLGQVIQSGLILIIILFQPELRSALERIGRGTLPTKDGSAKGRTETEVMVRELHKAILNLAKRRVGALVVIVQKTALEDIIMTGTKLDAEISSPLVENIFEPNTMLHDGAVIIKNGRIAAAACLLPLSDDLDIARELGTRHRAALGISSVSDSVTIVVSEETGIISVAKDGKLLRYMDAKSLKDTLESVFVSENEGLFPWLLRWRDKNGKEK